MDKKLYTFLSDGGWVETAEVLTNENAVVLVTEKGELINATGKIIMQNTLTKAEARQAAKIYQKTGFWPWELPAQEDDDSDAEDVGGIPWNEILKN
jgi:hypothetical protein